MSREDLIEKLGNLEKKLEEIGKKENMRRLLFEKSINGIILAVAAPFEIVDANPAAQRMFGRTLDQMRVAGTKELMIQDQRLSTAMAGIAQSGLWQGELDFVHENGVTFAAEVSAVSFSGPDGNETMSIIFKDITDRKLKEKQRDFTTSILDALRMAGGLRNSVHSILLLLQEYTGVEAIGIRLAEGEDYPYFETKGFGDDFVERERRLCSYNENGEIVRDAKGNPCLECMCGNVILGRTDPSLPFFTQGGSFWTNSTTTLLASTSDSDRQTRTRNRCNGEGYESVALISIKSHENTIGLVQLNDRRQGCFTLGEIEFLEQIAGSVGIAVERERVLGLIADSEKKLRHIVETSNECFWTVDQDFNIVFVNQRAEEVLGYEKGELLGRNIDDICFPEDSTIIEEKKRRRREGVRDRSELRLRCKDGSAVWVLQSSTPLIDSQGNFTGSLCMNTDITEIRNMQDDLVNKSRALEDTNNALRVLLKKREEDKEELEEKIVTNLRELIFPHLNELQQSRLNARQQGLVEILKGSLEEIASPFLHRIASLGLSPREVQIASLIKQGATTKDIATNIGISTRAVETHRYNIRKKLGLNTAKSNLRSYLQLRNT